MEREIDKVHMVELSTEDLISAVQGIRQIGGKYKTQYARCNQTLLRLRTQLQEKYPKLWEEIQSHEFVAPLFNSDLTHQSHAHKTTKFAQVSAHQICFQGFQDGISEAEAREIIETNFAPARTAFEELVKVSNNVQHLILWVKLGKSNQSELDLASEEADKAIIKSQKILKEWKGE